jgi:hypothetical protein
MKNMDSLKKELVVNKTDYKQLCDLLSQIENCAGMLINATKSANKYCAELKNKKEKQLEEIN